MLIFQDGGKNSKTGERKEKSEKAKQPLKKNRKKTIPDKLRYNQMGL